jgi:hypothetical protein
VKRTAREVRGKEVIDKRSVVSDRSKYQVYGLLGSNTV